MVDIGKIVPDVNIDSVVSTPDVHTTEQKVDISKNSGTDLKFLMNFIGFQNGLYKGDDLEILPFERGSVSNDSCEIRKIGNTVLLRLYFRITINDTSIDPINLLTIPNDYIVPYLIQEEWVNAHGKGFFVEINESNLTFFNLSNTALTNEWVRFNITYPYQIGRP